MNNWIASLFPEVSFLALWDVFLSMLSVGMLGYGGGYAMIPLMSYETVEQRGWYSTIDFSDMIALSTALPGPILSQIAGYIGFDQAGLFGLLVAVAALVLPSLVLMIVLGALILKHATHPRVQGMTALVRPLIVLMVLTLAFKFLGDSWGATALWVRDWSLIKLEGAFSSMVMISIFLFFLCLSWFFLIKKKWSPVLVILLMGSLGSLFMVGSEYVISSSIL